MSNQPITQEELNRRDRLIAAELLAAADEQAEKRIVSAVEAVMTNVTLHVGMSEKTVSAKIEGLKSTFRWQVIAGLTGGQTLAAIAAAYMTGNGQKAEAVAAALLPFV